MKQPKKHITILSLGAGIQSGENLASNVVKYISRGIDERMGQATTGR